MASRQDFSAKTKRVIAGRAGYRCSFPSCRKLTIGPGATHGEVATTGVAAHIYSASPEGPRGQGSKTPEELSAATNGIWLCSEHARLVDANRGERFPPALLWSYRELREARALRDQTGMGGPMAWFQEARLRTTPVFRADSVFRFGKVTVLLGENASGKTALCEWLAGVANPERLWRWTKKHAATNGIHLNLSYYDPEERCVDFQIDSSGELRYHVDGQPVPFHPQPVKLILVADSPEARREQEDDLRKLSLMTGLEEHVLVGAAGYVGVSDMDSVRNIRFEQWDGERVMTVDVDGTAPGLCFVALSGSEQTRVLMEYCAAVARFYARFTPTVLMIDTTYTLNESALSRYVSYFAHHANTFQTVLTTPHEQALEPSRMRLAGAHLVRLVGSVSNVVIEG